jgi:hypothetical protein
MNPALTRVQWHDGNVQLLIFVISAVGDERREGCRWSQVFERTILKSLWVGLSENS